MSKQKISTTTGLRVLEQYEAAKPLIQWLIDRGVIPEDYIDVHELASEYAAQTGLEKEFLSQFDM